MSTDSRTHYDVLGVTPSASQAQIREAFVRLSKQVHPDLNHGDPKSTDRFLRLRDAFTVLSSSELRREYDMQLQRTRLHEWSHFTGEFDPPNQSRYGRDNRSSRMHSDYRSDQQQQQPPDESHIRYFFAAFRSMLDHKPKQQPKESAGNDPNQSRFERVTETLHRSTTWRPPPIFFPIASAVTLIGAVIGTSVGVTWLYIASRTDRERDEMNRKITEARRLQQSLPANKAS